MSEMMPCVLSWRGGLQGRFSGRLETKDDEKRLADECKLLGPLLGGLGKRGEKSRLTLAKIVRGIATGDVRKYCSPLSTAHFSSKWMKHGSRPSLKPFR